MAREADGVLRLAAVVRYEVELARRRRRAHLVDVVPVVDIDFQRAVLAGLELRGLGDDDPGKRAAALAACPGSLDALHVRSEEHTSELQSLMRISYAVFCLKKKKTKNITVMHSHHHTKHGRIHTEKHLNYKVRSKSYTADVY